MTPRGINDAGEIVGGIAERARKWLYGRSGIATTAHPCRPFDTVSATAHSLTSTTTVWPSVVTFRPVRRDRTPVSASPTKRASRHANAPGSHVSSRHLAYRRQRRRCHDWRLLSEVLLAGTWLRVRRNDLERRDRPRHHLGLHLGYQ